MEWELKVTLFQIQRKYTWLAVLWPSSRNKLLTTELGFHGSSEGKESTCNAGGPSVIPVLARSPGEAKGYPLQCSCLGNPMDRGAWRVHMGSQRVRHDLATEPPPPLWCSQSVPCSDVTKAVFTVVIRVLLCTPLSHIQYRVDKINIHHTLHRSLAARAFPWWWIPTVGTTDKAYASKHKRYLQACPSLASQQQS